MQASSSDESFLGPVSCTLGTNLNAKLLTAGSFLTVGLTVQLALGSTEIFISLKLLLYNNVIAVGGRAQWAITVSYNVMLVTHGMMLADSSSLVVLRWSHSSASKGRTERTSYSLLHEHSVWAKKSQSEKMWKVTFWLWFPALVWTEQHWQFKILLPCLYCLTCKREYIPYHLHGTVFIKSKNLIQIRALRNLTPRNSQFTFHNLSYKRIQKEQCLLDLANQRLKGNMITVCKIIPGGISAREGK